MCRVLRYFAHKNGASLLYVSVRDTRSTSALRSVLNNYVFGLPAKKLCQTEYTGSIMISAGADSFAAQGPPPGVQGEVSSLDDTWMQAFNQMFPKV
jgi:dynein light intermediate chain 2